MKNEQSAVDFLVKALQEKHSLPEAIGFSTTDLDEIAAYAVKLYEEGKLESSLKLLEGLTNLCPDKSDYWTALGGVLTRLERYEQAIPVLTVALGINNKNTAALVNRGECYIAMAQNEKAASDLGHAIDLDPRNEDQASNRARQIAFVMHNFFQECTEEGLNTVEISDGL